MPNSDDPASVESMLRAALRLLSPPAPQSPEAAEAAGILERALAHLEARPAPRTYAYQPDITPRGRPAARLLVRDGAGTWRGALDGAPWHGGAALYDDRIDAIAAARREVKR